MNNWTILLLGILIGWLIEWVIDWLYWRNRSTGSDKDVLQAIDGIGPVISEKLYAAGINTWEALGKLKRADMEKIVGAEIKNLSDETEIINEAKKFAKIKKEIQK